MLVIYDLFAKKLQGAEVTEVLHSYVELAVLERIKVASYFFGCILSVEERLFPVLFVTEELKQTKHTLGCIPSLKTQACEVVRRFSNRKWFFELGVVRAVCVVAASGTPCLQW